RAPRPQRNFNHDLAVAVKAALTGSARERGPVDFSPDLEPLISHYVAKRDLTAQHTERPDSQSAPEVDSREHTFSVADGLPLDGSTSQLAGPVSLQPTRLGEQPATPALPSAGQIFLQPKNSLASGTEGGPNFYSIAPTSFAPSSSSPGAPVGLLLKIENTIEAADDVMRLAQDAVRATEPARRPDDAAAFHHERALILPTPFRLGLTLGLAIPLSAAIAWLIVVGPRSGTRTATARPDAAALISHPSEPADEAASDAVKQPAHAAVEPGSGPASKRAPAAASEERGAPTILSPVASTWALTPSAPPERVGTDASGVGAAPSPSGRRD